ncbi:c-type cytochrome [Planctomicrobium sp. SH668]|uniref:c-type cytochrome n=1 Tax=Planctomicrobium sp. SH668 TaxID=3448126 RepID=UPI003F5B5A02
MKRWRSAFCSRVVYLMVLSLCVAQTSSAQEIAQWIWSGDTKDDAKVELRKVFEVTDDVASATLVGTADNKFTAWVNNQEVLSVNEWKELPVAEVLPHLIKGKNVLAIQGQNEGGIAAVIAVLRLRMKNGEIVEIKTDGSWKGTENAPGNWREAGFDDSPWKPVTVIDDANSGPWKGSVNVSAIQDALNTDPQAAFRPIVAKNVTQRPDFVVERVVQVPRNLGSWVALTKDPQGRLIASAQGDEGLYLIVPGDDENPSKVEKLPVDLSGAQGLCWAFDSLYVVINGGPKSGLHRARDTNGDGLVDTSEHIMPIAGGGEHGPHAIILSPDQKSLHVLAGNHSAMPEGITGSRIPQNWSEDHLLPRRWDANGHAAGLLAPGGWILKIDPEAKQREVISMGYRNQYDIAFNADGELFTYDADMEWDLGAPWYRPTRVCHATSGSEFGWRSGTGKWPAYYEDSLPAVVDIGPGSPVGIVFGEGAKFPEKYQRALFLLDWTYSTIYSVNLVPSGSTYTAVKEEFLVGEPMQVTDAIVGDDGALYFAAGGRGTASSLYRVRYTGSESTAPVDLKDSRDAGQRAVRHQLEAFHGKTGGGDLDLIFKHLGSDDRFIRYAARVALEWQPVAEWRDRVLKGEAVSPRAAINGAIALAHQGASTDLESALELLEKIDYSALDEQGKLGLLRAYELLFVRLGAPSENVRLKLIDRLDALYPAPTYSENAELVQLLVYLNAPTVVSKTLALMRELGPEPLPDWGYLTTRGGGYGGTVGALLANHPPARAVHFAFMLRNKKGDWTLAEREEYFKFFIDAAKYPGGNSFAKFLDQFREDAFLNSTPAEQAILAPIAGQSLLAPLPQFDPPVGPGRKWTREEALATIENQLRERNFERGRQLYFTTSCGKCHRLNGEGGAIGPDLSTAGKKFPLADMLDNILDPSKVISDQYASHQLVTTDGEVLSGRAMQVGDEYYVYTVDADARPRVIKASDVDEIAPSQISQMPVGLVDTLNPEELKDLMAYLMSGGNKDSDYFKKK